MANSYTTKLKKRLPAVGDVNWDNEWHENERLDDVIAGALLSINRVISGGAVTNVGALTVEYLDMVVVLNGVRTSLASGDVLLSAAPAGMEASHWIYVDASGDVVSSPTPPSGTYIPLAMVDVNSVGILRIADLRPMSLLDKDGSGGIPGLTAFKINFMSVLGTIKSFFTNANTVARTYTFQNRDGTIADLADIALKANIDSPTFTGTPSGPSPAATDNSTRFATTQHLILAFAGNASANGYQKFKSGIVIQWGFITTSSTAGTASPITFPLEFSVVPYAVIPGVWSFGTTAISAWASNLTTTACDIRCSAASATIRWVAIGFITPA